MKRKFREALERKRGNHASAEGADHTGKVQAPTALPPAAVPSAARAEASPQGRRAEPGVVVGEVAVRVVHDPGLAQAVIRA